MKEVDWVDSCPYCGEVSNESLQSEISELETKICRLENHVMASDKIIAELNRLIASYKAGA